MGHAALKDHKIRKLIPRRGLRHSSVRSIQNWGNESSEKFLRALRKEQNSLADHSEGYTRIGELLTTAESAFVTVGTPFLWPTARVRKLRKQCDQPMEEMLRVNLVGVPTRVIEFYVQELDDLSAEANSLARLSVVPPSRLERVAPLAFMVPFLFVIFFSILQISLSTLLASVGAFAATGLIISGLVVLSSDTYRRISFSLFLSREILRRRGENTPGGPNLRMCPIS